MPQKKICMLGASAVGKTSLVARYVRGIFSERYLTTVGVKIDAKEVALDGRTLELVVWDLNGEDRFQKISMSYLRGASGYLLVADGTRRVTLEAALALHERTREAIGAVPAILVLNKTDLEADWDLTPADEEALAAQGWSLCRTSAKTGTGVEEAFLQLAEQLLPA